MPQRADASGKNGIWKKVRNQETVSSFVCTRRHASGCRRVEHRELAHARRVPDREVPGDAAAPVVRGDEGVLVAERGDEARDVVTEAIDCVRLDAARLVGIAVAALIGKDHAVAGLRERNDHALPRVPELRKAVQQHDRRTVGRSGAHHEQLDVADVDPARVDFDVEFAARRLHCVEARLVAGTVTEREQARGDPARETEDASEASWNLAAPEVPGVRFSVLSGYSNNLTKNNLTPGTASTP